MKGGQRSIEEGGEGWVTTELKVLLKCHRNIKQWKVKLVDDYILGFNNQYIDDIGKITLEIIVVYEGMRDMK